jgi:endoglucanase
MESEELQKRFVALWLELEKEFSSDGDIYFELLNEVRDIDPELWNDLAERTIHAIRGVNPSRKIIVGSTRWNSSATLDRLRVYDDENVIYTFHCYAPHEFTHQRGVLQAPHLFYNREMPYPCEDIERYRDFRRVVKNQSYYEAYDRMDIQYLRDYLAPVRAFLQAHPDKILWCGEFGTIRHARLEWREAWMRDVISILKEWDIPYCVWNYLSTPNDGNRFSLVDDDHRRILSDRLHRIICGKE